jgi:MarR family transcriptional regulator, transcriptional regulator for hemolysin
MEGEPLSRQIVMTAKTIKELFEDALAQQDATLANWVVLNGVERGRWASQTGLAKELRIEGATVTRHLDRLEREGLVTRSRDLEDRRQISVELTAAGKALHRRLRRATIGRPGLRGPDRQGSFRPAARAGADPSQRGR